MIISHQAAQVSPSRSSLYLPTTLSKTHNPNTNPVHLSRLILSTTLFFTAVLCGVGSYLYMSGHEHSWFLDEFHEVSGEIIENIEGELGLAAFSSLELATVTGMIYPDRSSWPNASIDGFQDIGANMAAVGGLWLIVNCPIVRANEVESFEAYAADIFANDPSISSHALTYIWKMIEDGSYVHDDGSSLVGNDDIDFLAPSLNVANVSENSEYLMFNIVSHPQLTATITDVYNCAESGSHNCADVTDFYNPHVGKDGIAFVNPTFPLKAKSTLVGFSIAAVYWEDIIFKSVPSNAKDVIVGVETSTGSHSYYMHKHKSHLKEGLKHSNAMSQYERSREMLMRGRNICNIYIYPSREYYNSFHSLLPLLTSILSVVIILISSGIFLLHDYFVDKESGIKDELLASKKRYVRFISHEVRTPLNTVSLGLQLLIKHLGILDGRSRHTEDNSDTIRDAMEIATDVQISADAAIIVLNDLLNYDKIESNTMKFERELHPVWKLFRKSIALMEIEATQRNIKLEVIFPDLHEKSMGLHKLFVWGDSGRLGQVVRNLISNALKFSPGGSSITVRAQFVAEGCPIGARQCMEECKEKYPDWEISDRGGIEVSVEDNGPGISKENQKLLFNEGVQFNPNKLQAGQGAGLGLTIAKGIVEGHHGKIWVTSEGEGKGSKFYIELPVVEVNMAVCDDELNSRQAIDNPTLVVGEEKGDSSGNHRMDSLSLQKLVILIVDDVPLCRKMLSKVLSQRGHECVHASDGAECLALLQADPSRFDCILMDNEMPKLSGPLATKRIREMGMSVLVIGVTGNVMDEDVHSFMASGADHVLPKPFDMDEFERITSCLRV